MTSAKVRFIARAIALCAALSTAVAASSSCAGEPRTPAGRTRPSVAAATDPLAPVQREMRVRLAAAPVRVLFPRDRQLAEKAIVTVGDNWYALSIPLGDHSLFLQGTDASAAEPAPPDVPARPRPHRVRGVPARILVNEQIRSVAWAEQGVEYALEVECERAFDDARCTESAYLIGNAEALVALAPSVLEQDRGGAP